MKSDKWSKMIQELKITCIYWFIIMMSAKKPQDNLDIRITECCFRHKQKFFWFTKTISDQLNEKSNFGPNKAYSESQNIHVKSWYRLELMRNYVLCDKMHVIPILESFKQGPIAHVIQ